MVQTRAQRHMPLTSQRSPAPARQARSFVVGIPQEEASGTQAAQHPHPGICRYSLSPVITPWVYLLGSIPVYP